MASERLTERLLALPDAAAQRRLLEAHAHLLGDEVADALKEEADRFLRSDLQRSLETAELILHTAELTHNPLHRALGLLAEANARAIGLAEYERAIDLYNEAADTYRARGCVVRQARSQIGKLNPLAKLGRYTEALEAGEWASDVLQSHAQWLPLATLTLNLGAIHARLGDDIQSLELYDKARELYRRLGKEGEPFLPWVDQNRSIRLCNLGRFEASIRASNDAVDALTRLAQTAEAARARMNLAVTYFILGRYNESLELLDRVRDVFWADGRQRDAILVDLLVCDCLLQLRRFRDVLDRCRRIRGHFTDLGTRLEVGQALLDEAVAYAGLHHYGEATSSLADAHHLFTEEGSRVWVANADLEMASVLLRRGRFGECLATAQACGAVFQTHGRPIEEARALLLGAQAACALRRYEEALEKASGALAVARSRDIPSLSYQGHAVLGALAVAKGELQSGLNAYAQAIEELERLRGRLMVEFRVDFLEDKQGVYEDMVRLCLDTDQPLRALEYAERAKSRALLDLLAYRLDLSIQAREDADQPVVEELTHLRRERDRLYRRWEGSEESREQGWIAGEELRQQVLRDVLDLEKQITALWHRLLIRNASYARDAALWQVRTEPVQPYLTPETLLIEYFVQRGQLVVFLVTGDGVAAHRLDGSLTDVRQLVRLLWLNLKAVPRSPPGRVRGLAQNARGLLQRLHALLMAPLSDITPSYPRLIIVPHGPLHYLPFHALHDGTAFVLERHEFSYLPGASLLRYCHDVEEAPSGLLAMGHSHRGQLPYAAQEAHSIARLMGEHAFLEDAATLATLRERASDCRILHLAAHGEFRPDNPLFSGLALADGWLTTLEIFNLRLRASLVTLSGCQTGRSVVGGGDELLGLERALLYAGAASVLLSLWMVEDRSTAQLMETFYRMLAEGHPKGVALQHAQLQFIAPQDSQGEATGGEYAHPYFWAPFFLVGHAGAL
jgi:CHAT domain-containing protein/tetratricopeptide (TPR) repeat protein